MLSEVHKKSVNRDRIPQTLPHTSKTSWLHNYCTRHIMQACLNCIRREYSNRCSRISTTIIISGAPKQFEKATTIDEIRRSTTKTVTKNKKAASMLTLINHSKRCRSMCANPSHILLTRNHIRSSAAASWSRHQHRRLQRARRPIRVTIALQTRNNSQIQNCHNSMTAYLFQIRV